MQIDYTEAFKRQLQRLARRYRRIRRDIEPVIEQLQAGELPGDQIQQVGYALFKVRVRNRDARRGKSGGYRIIYYLKTDTHIILLTVYSKSDQGDITAARLRELVAELGSQDAAS